MALTFEHLREINVKRCEGSFFPLDHWTPSDWAMAMMGEGGEACNKLKKRNRGEEVSSKEIAHELADMITYADLLAARLGISLEDAIREKFNIVSERVGSDLRL